MGKCTKSCGGIPRPSDLGRALCSPPQKQIYTDTCTYPPRRYFAPPPILLNLAPHTKPWTETSNHEDRIEKTDLVLAGQHEANLSTGISGYGHVGIWTHRIQLPTILHHLLDEIQCKPNAFSCTERKGDSSVLLFSALWSVFGQKRDFYGFCWVSMLQKRDTQIRLLLHDFSMTIRIL